MCNTRLGADGGGARGAALTKSISAAMGELYTEFYDPDRTTATTYVNDKIVVFVAENVLTTGEDVLVANGGRGAVIDGRVALQSETEDEFTAAIERLTRRRVVAFLRANQTAPGVVCDLFFLDASPQGCERLST